MLGERLERQIGQAQQAVVIGPRQRPRHLEARKAVEQLLEHSFEFQPREVRAEAEMSAQPEADVKVRITRKVEAKRLRENVRVAIRRHLPHRYLLPLPDRTSAQLDVARR